MNKRKSMPLYAILMNLSVVIIFNALFFFPAYRFEALGYSWSYRVCIMWGATFVFFVALVIGVVSVIAARLNASKASVPAVAND